MRGKTGWPVCDREGETGGARAGLRSDTRGWALAEWLVSLSVLLAGFILVFQQVTPEEENQGERWAAYIRGEPAAAAAFGSVPLAGSVADEQSERGWADRLGELWEGIWKGDFSESDSGWTTAGQILGGLVPYVGQVADARDSIAAVKEFWNEPGLATGGNAFMAVVGWVPGVGDAAKAAWKGWRGGGDEAAQAVAVVARRARTLADEEAAVARIARNAETYARNCTNGTCTTASMNAALGSAMEGLDYRIAYVELYRDGEKKFHAVTVVKMSDGSERWMSYGDVFDSMAAIEQREGWDVGRTSEVFSYDSVADQVRERVEMQLDYPAPTPLPRPPPPPPPPEAPWWKFW